MLPAAALNSAGGNGIASALPVFEELSAAGVRTRGLPALLVWACRKGHEFEFMAARVLAAAQALGLDLTLKLHVTGDGGGWVKDGWVKGGWGGSVRVLQGCGKGLGGVWVQQRRSWVFEFEHSLPIYADKQGSTATSMCTQA